MFMVIVRVIFMVMVMVLLVLLFIVMVIVILVKELVSCVPSLQLVDASFCTQLEETEVRQLRQDSQNLTIKWSFIDVQ